MAKATKSTRIVERVVIETHTAGVTLELSDIEAQVLAVVLSKVGGDASRTARGQTAAILYALGDAGVSWYGSKFSYLGRGGITFSASV